MWFYSTADKGSYTRSNKSSKIIYTKYNATFEVMVTIHKRHEVMNIGEHPACKCGDKHEWPMVVSEGVWGSNSRGSSRVATAHTDTLNSSIPLTMNNLPRTRK
jgi:hypothetical protein